MSKGPTLLRAPLGITGVMEMIIGICGICVVAAEGMGWAMFWWFFAITIIGGASTGVSYELDARLPSSVGWH